MMAQSTQVVPAQSTRSGGGALPRLGVLLRHLESVAPPSPRQASGHSTTPACVSGDSSTAGLALGATSSHSTAEHLANLARDGVTVVEDVYSQAELADIQSSLTAACAEVRAALPALAWNEMRYQAELVAADAFCTGRALYEGKRSAGFKDTEIIDLTNGRFDFYGGVLKDRCAFFGTMVKLKAIISLP